MRIKMPLLALTAGFRFAGAFSLARAFSICLSLAVPVANRLPAQAPASGSGSVLTLREVLDSVAARHPLVEASRARVRAARGSRSSAGRFGNPVLTYQVENAPLPGRSASGMDREIMTTAMIPLEPLYQRGSRVRRANADIRAAEAVASATTQEVMLDAARAYYGTAMAQVAFDAARDIGSWLDTVVAYNRARVREGVAAEADLLRSEVERDRAAVDAALAEADLARARTTLASFVGPTAPVMASPASEDTAGIRVRLDVAALPLPPILAELHPGNRADSISPRLLTVALDGRPQVQAARARVTSATAMVSTERSMFVRQLSAMLGTKQTAGASTLIAGLSVPVPLFDQNRGEIARAAGERDAAAFELAAEVRETRALVLGAAEAARVLTSRVQQLSEHDASGQPAFLGRADEARRIALGAYREGAVPLLSVLDAARAWAEARLTYYHIVYAQHESVLALLAAQGLDVMSALPEPSNGEGR